MLSVSRDFLSNTAYTPAMRLSQLPVWSSEHKAGYTFPSIMTVNDSIINPLTPELNPSTQHFLMRFFTGDVAS
jgi:hypothetical protein